MTRRRQTSLRVWVARRLLNRAWNLRARVNERDDRDEGLIAAYSDLDLALADLWESLALALCRDPFALRHRRR